MKLDTIGNEAWVRSFNGSMDDNLFAAQQTSDGGYVAAGYTKSSGAGGYDVWVVKVDANGSPDWEKTYGTLADEEAYSIQQTSDGGYILAGGFNMFGATPSDMWVLKLDANGNCTGPGCP